MGFRKSYVPHTLSAVSIQRLTTDAGVVNVTQKFTTVYDKNTTGPTFYYCKVGQHCANGMFGIIKYVPFLPLPLPPSLPRPLRLRLR